MDHFKRAVKFGKTLIETGDLDPVYLALPRETRMRVTLAYIFLYHLGAAAFIGEARNEKFWNRLDIAARNENLIWPRGSKSYCNGHYPLGKDTVEVYHALAEPRWGGLVTLMRKKVAPLAAYWDGEK